MNGPAEDDDGKIIMVNSCAAFGGTNRSESGNGFHKILCNKGKQTLWLIAHTHA